MTRRRISAAVILFFEEDQPPSVRSDADTTLEELDEPSAIKPVLSKCMSLLTEQKKAAR